MESSHPVKSRRKNSIEGGDSEKRSRNRKDGRRHDPNRHKSFQSRSTVENSENASGGLRNSNNGRNPSSFVEYSNDLDVHDKSQNIWPTFYPGAASLYEELDKTLMLVLRDGRHLIGIMRSYDQYSNVVLENTHERHFVGNAYGDIPLGYYIVRGDSIAIMGEISEDDNEMSTSLKRVSAEEILQMQQEFSNIGMYNLDWDFGDVI